MHDEVTTYVLHEIINQIRTPCEDNLVPVKCVSANVSVLQGLELNESCRCLKDGQLVKIRTAFICNEITDIFGGISGFVDINNARPVGSKTTLDQEL